MIRITAKQLRAALEVCNPDGPENHEQAETEILIWYRGTDNPSEDGEPQPRGMYCLLWEHPEKGFFSLDKAVQEPPKSAASAAPTMSRIRPSWERLMAKIDRTVLLTQGLMVLPLFPLAVLTELCSREIGTKQAIRDAWSSWKAHFVLKPNDQDKARP